MTDGEKLTMLRTLLDDGGALPSDEKLGAYLNLAEIEILPIQLNVLSLTFRLQQVTLHMKVL